MNSVTPLADRPQPPAAPEAEQALLGAILINNSAHSRVASSLLPEHFGNAAHSRIYEAIGNLSEHGIPVDPVTIKTVLGDDPALVPIGGSAQYLARLLQSTVTVINAEHYGRAIVEAAGRRLLVDVGQAVDENTCDPAVPLAGIMPRAMQGITEFATPHGLKPTCASRGEA